MDRLKEIPPQVLAGLVKAKAAAANTSQRRRACCSKSDVSETGGRVPGDSKQSFRSRRPRRSRSQRTAVESSGLFDNQGVS
jgi:hypothetical protein